MASMHMLQRCPRLWFAVGLCMDFGLIADENIFTPRAMKIK
jgi:hypothetical protein